MVLGCCGAGNVTESGSCWQLGFSYVTVSIYHRQFLLAGIFMVCFIDRYPCLWFCIALGMLSQCILFDFVMDKCIIFRTDFGLCCQPCHAVCLQRHLVSKLWIISPRSHVLQFLCHMFSQALQPAQWKGVVQIDSDSNSLTWQYNW